MSSHVSDAEKDIKTFKKYGERASRIIEKVGKVFNSGGPVPISTYGCDEFERVKKRYREIP